MPLPSSSTSSTAGRPAGRAAGDVSIPLEGAGLNEAETGSAGLGAVGPGLLLGTQADARSVRQPIRIHPRLTDQVYKSMPLAVSAPAALLALGPVHPPLGGA